MLEALDVSVSYGGFRALNGASAASRPRQHLGAGRAQRVGQVDAAEHDRRGARADGGRAASGWPPNSLGTAPRRMARNGIGHAFQTPRLARRLDGLPERDQFAANRINRASGSTNLFFNPSRVSRSRGKRIAACDAHASRRLDLAA